MLETSQSLRIYKWRQLNLCLPEGQGTHNYAIYIITVHGYLYAYIYHYDTYMRMLMWEVLRCQNEDFSTEESMFNCPESSWNASCGICQTGDVLPHFS